ncbi:MAG: LAGLIDADG family homing endonuclease [Nitrososphaerales archaeon]
MITRKLSELFEEFLRTWQDRAGAYKYRERIAQLAATGDRSVVVDYEDIIQFNTDLGERLLSQPDESLKEFRMAAFEVLSTENASYAGQVKSSLNVRIRGITDKVSLRKVNTSHLDKMIAVAGMVVRSSELRPLLTDAAFVCPNGHVTKVLQEGVVIKRPMKCEGCEETRYLELDEKRSAFIDSQILRVQELPEELPPGQLPRFFDVDVVGDIVNTARPGDRIVLSGVVRAEMDISPGQARTRVFRSKIDSNLIEVAGKDPGQIQITKEDEFLIRSVADHPDAYQRLIKSVAPAILGHEAVKEAILLLLVGGPQTVLPDGTKLRGDINVFIVGDPGVAKSEMLKFAAQVAPRGMFASGKGSTAAGLSAAVIREKNTFMLEAGVVVLADQGIACIDEFDKMKEDDRSALHEQMEQQSYHPSTEILLSDGRKVKVGEFVESALRTNREEVVHGRDCDVAPLGRQTDVYTADLGNGRVARAPVDRVSRHRAPRYFVRIRYSNGRSILVTPEHPAFVYGDGGIATVRADRLQPGDFVPAPRLIPNSSTPVQLANQIGTGQSEEIAQPSTLSLKTARILGYLITEGNFYEGSSVEVDFTNLDQRLIDEMRDLMREEFKIDPTLRRSEGRNAGLRYVSKTLHAWLRLNFPEMVHKAREKRAPAKILGASVAHINEFLASAFLGDGSVESEAVCYRTASPGLAEDYQDLLLKLGVSSRINVDRSNDSFKVYITGDSLERFFAGVVHPLDPRFSTIRKLVERSGKNDRKHDVLPTAAARLYISLLKQLGLRYDGRFGRHLAKGHGINVTVMKRDLGSLEERSSNVLRVLEDGELTLREFRRASGWSQQRLADLIGVPRGVIDYAERGGYSEVENGKISEEARAALRTQFGSVQAISYLKDLMGLRFLRVTEVDRVGNVGSDRVNWVYDVTVEPTHNFVSAGAVLHNTITIAKGGIYATLNARTSILAAANPILGKYDPYKNLTDNITLPIPLLTRFDLIFVVKDTPTPAQDEKLATHILDVHRRRGFTEQPPVQFDLMKKYIAYAKKISPTLTMEAENRLKEYYLQLRRSVTEGQIGATPRTLESLIRLSSARARLMLRDQVLEEDALAAVSLMNRMVEDVLTDTETKTKADFGILLGQPAGERGKLSTSMEIFRTMEGQEKKPVELKLFREELVKSGRFKNDDEVDKMIQKLIKEGIIWENRPGFYRRVQA